MTKLPAATSSRKAQTQRLLDRNLTPKQRVLKKYPEAECITGGPGWCVFHRLDTAGGPIGRGPTAQAAWADAATRIKNDRGGMYP